MHKRQPVVIQKLFFAVFLLLNGEKHRLKLVNLDVYKIIENFWTDIVYCQFLIVMFVQAGVNLTLKIMWKLIINKKKELIGMEVRNVSLPNVLSIAKQNAMVLAKNIVPNFIKESIDDLELLKQFPQKMPALLGSLDSLTYLSGNEVSIEEASSIPMDVFSIQKMVQKKNIIMMKTANPSSNKIFLKKKLGRLF